MERHRWLTDIRGYRVRERWTLRAAAWPRTPTIDREGIRRGERALRGSAASYRSVTAVITATLAMSGLSWAAGEKITFHSQRDGNREIYSMDPDGSNQTRLTNNTFTDGEPTWSPGGSRIAFNTNRDANTEIYVMDADGSNQTNLTNAPGSVESEPAWSPDGSKIAFQTNRDGFRWRVAGGTG